MYLEFEKKLDLIKKLDNDSYNELIEQFGDKLDDYFRKYINSLDVNDIDVYNKIGYYIDLKSDFTEVNDINSNFNKSFIIYMKEVSRYARLSEKESSERLNIICTLRDELKRLNVNDSILNNILLKYNYNKKIKNDLLSRKIQLKFLKNNFDRVSNDDYNIFDMYVKYLIEKEYFFNCNLRLVIYFARMRAHNDDDLLDSIQSGNMGLMKAIDKYDNNNDTVFSTYASYWINNYMIRNYKRSASAINVPYNTIELVSGYNRFCDDFYNINGRMPCDEEKLSYFLKKLPKAFLSRSEFEKREYAKKQLKNVECAIARGNIVSLDSPFSMEDEESALIDFVEDSTVNVENVLCNKELKNKFREAFKLLSSKECCILMLRNEIRIADYLSFEEVKDVFKNLTDEQIKQLWVSQYRLTLEQIGMLLSITREYVRQIEKRSKDKIKKKEKKFKDYI